MATVTITPGSTAASAIQSAVQPKLIDVGWVVEENDTTLTEYITTLLINGKNEEAVRAELGGDLLGLGEDDPTVISFAQWLFDLARKTVAPPQDQQQKAQESERAQEPQPIPSVQDSQMEDASAPVDGAPTGPKSMRSGNNGRGRGGRMLGQLNRQMDRQELPESLRRIKGAAGGGAGRINAHASRDGAPRGPRAPTLANGVQRMMNGGGRGGHGMNNFMPQMPVGGVSQEQQVKFMQFVEEQTNMMRQMLKNSQMSSPTGGFKQGRGGKQNGQFKGRQHQLPSQQHAVNGKLPDGPLQPLSDADSGMEIDGQGSAASRKDLFSTLCYWNYNCTNPACQYAHQSPAAPPDTTVDLTDTCPFNVACANSKCSGRHPSPAKRNGGGYQSTTVCKFYPDCKNPNCPFLHTTEMPLCRNGADCSVPNCKFTHSKIMCRYAVCLNPACTYKHAKGQKKGDAGEDANDNNGTSDRFAGFSEQNDGEEELILPGQQDAPAEGVPTQQDEEIVA